MADEVLVEELRQRCAEVVERMRGCAQADEPPRPNESGVCPAPAFFPLAGQVKTWEAVRLQVARHFGA